jgi:hypothetical protein
MRSRKVRKGLDDALNKYFALFGSTEKLASELIRNRKYPVEVLILLCARLDALASEADPKETSSKRAFRRFLTAYSGKNALFDCVSVGELYYELRYHRWLLEGTIPQAGRIHRFSNVDDPTIQLLEDAGLPLTLHDSATLLDTLTRILRSEFRVKPGQPLSKRRISKASELEETIVSAAQKTRLRAISVNLPKALKSLIDSKKVGTILYDRFRCGSIHGATIILNEERFFSEKELYWEPRYSDYHGSYEFLEFPGQFLLDCLDACINTYSHHLRAKRKLPPDVHFHVFGDDIMAELELLDHELLPEGGAVRLRR